MVERRGDVGKLAVEVFLALARLLELVDGREIHLPEFLEIGARASQRFLPGRHRGIGSEPREDLREFEARGRKLLDESFAPYARFLRHETRLLDAGARRVDARLGIETLLVERTQCAVGIFERAALGAEFRLDIQSAREEILELAFELDDGQVAVGERRLELGRA